MIVSISRFVTCAVSEIIERVVLIWPSTSSSYWGSLVLTPIRILFAWFWFTTRASFSLAPVPTANSIDSSPWSCKERTFLYARVLPAVITPKLVLWNCKLSSSTFDTIYVPSASPPDTMIVTYSSLGSGTAFCNP